MFNSGDGGPSKLTQGILGATMLGTSVLQGQFTLPQSWPDQQNNYEEIRVEEQRRKIEEQQRALASEQNGVVNSKPR
jgi:hypothetical protein